MPGDLVPTKPGAELAALFDPSVDGAFLSPQERPLLAALLVQDDRIDIAIPADTPADDLWRTVLLVSKVFTRLTRAHSILKLLIGRALVLIQDRPELYESRGFRSMDAFLSDEVRGLPALLGISRGELYKAKSVAEKNPTLPIALYREIGFSKLGEISRVTEEGNANYPAWLEKARTSTYKELVRSIEESNLQIAEGGMTPAVFAINCREDQRRELSEFVEDPRIHSVNGTADKAEILLNSTREARAEWLNGADERPDPDGEAA